MSLENKRKPLKWEGIQPIIYFYLKSKLVGPKANSFNTG